MGSGSRSKGLVVAQTVVVARRNTLHLTIFIAVEVSMSGERL